TYIREDFLLHDKSHKMILIQLNMHYIPHSVRVNMEKILSHIFTTILVILFDSIRRWEIFFSNYIDIFGRNLKFSSLLETVRDRIIKTLEIFLGCLYGMLLDLLFSMFCFLHVTIFIDYIFDFNDNRYQDFQEDGLLTFFFLFNIIMEKIHKKYPTFVGSYRFALFATVNS
ncbi:hypothetical protein ACJX0J_026030, partial [Zea mays]